MKPQLGFLLKKSFSFNSLIVPSREIMDIINLDQKLLEILLCLCLGTLWTGRESLIVHIYIYIYIYIYIHKATLLNVGRFRLVSNRFVSDFDEDFVDLADRFVTVLYILFRSLFDRTLIIN